MATQRNSATGSPSAPHDGGPSFEIARASAGASVPTLAFKPAIRFYTTRPVARVLRAGIIVGIAALMILPANVVLDLRRAAAQGAFGSVGVAGGAQQPSSRPSAPHPQPGGAPLPPHPSTFTCNLHYTNCNFCDPPFDPVELALNPSGTQAKISWIYNGSESETFKYGTTSPPTTSHAISTSGGRNLVTLTVINGTVYYYNIYEISTLSGCGALKPHQGNFTASFLAQSGLSGGSEGGNCPVGQAIATNVSFSEPTHGGSATLTWKSQTVPAGLPMALNTTVEILPSGGGNRYYYSATSPIVFGTTAQWYTAYISVTGACLEPGGSAMRVWGGCAQTAIEGYVRILGTTTPVFDTEMQITGTGLSATPRGLGASGLYYDTMGSSCGTSTSISQIWADALGFNQYISGGINLPAYNTTWLNISLSPVSTSTSAVFTYPGSSNLTYDLNQYLNQNVTPTWSIDSSQNIQSGTTSLQWVSACRPSCQSTPPAPPSNTYNGKVLKLSAIDTSTGAAGNHFSELGVALAAPSPWPATYGAGASPAFSAPMFLEFNVYVPSSSYNTHFSVDALLSDTAYLSQSYSGTYQLPYDMQGRVCRASSITYQPNTWVQETCDLSNFIGWYNITSFILLYNNAGIPGSGSSPITAYFDSIRLVNAVLPTTIANGGFEVWTKAGADGWVGGGVLGYVQNPAPGGTVAPYDGDRSAVMGWPPASTCAKIVCPPINVVPQISQFFRPPNYLPYGAPTPTNLTFRYLLNDSCPTYSECQTSMSYFDVFINDFTTGQQSQVFSQTPAQGFGSFGIWTYVDFNLTKFEGHFIQLEFQVSAASYKHDGNWFSDNATVYLDDVYTNGWSAGFGSVSAPYRSQSNFTGWLDLSKKVYLAGGTNPFSWGFGYDVEGFNTRSTGVASYWQNSSNGWNATPILSTISSGIDVYNFFDDTSSNDQGDLQFTVHADANSSGLVSPSPYGDWCVTPCEYDYIASLSISVVATYEPGNGANVWTSYNALEAIPNTPIGLRNLSSPNLQYAGVSLTEQSTTAESISWVALGVLTGVAESLLFGGLPIVFQAVIGEAIGLAEGWAQNYVDQSESNYGANCVASVVTAGPSNAPTQLTDTCMANPASGAFNSVTQSAAMSFPLEVAVGKPNPQSGAIYSIALIASVTTCHYNGPPPGSAPSGCWPDSNAGVTEDVLTVWTY